MLGPLYFFHLLSGEFRQCLQYAERCTEIAARLGDSAATALSRTLLGLSYCLVGRLAEARTTLAPVLDPASPPASRQIHYGFDHHTWAGIGWSTTLWLQGHPNQARAAIRQAFRDAEAIRHPVSFAISLSSIATLLWIGDLDFAEEHSVPFIARAETLSFGPYLPMGHAFEAEIAIRRGDVEAGVAALHAQLRNLHVARFELFTIRFHFVLISGFLASGRFAEAWTLAEETAQMIEEKGYYCYPPELLRLRGSILLAAPQVSNVEAETYFSQSLEISRVQGARAWEIRTATDLALLWAGQGRNADADAALRPLFHQLTEGRDTPDLKAAATILKRLG